MLKPHIVILGAGFGGVYVAKALLDRVKNGEIDVTIINRTNYFLFTPLLHEVATGGLSPRSVAEPLREVFAGTGVRIIQGNIDIIDQNNKTVKVAGAVIPYDYLVIATGAETNYYGIPGAEKLTYPLKSLADAVRIRSRIIDAFEQAILTNDPIERTKLLSFVVVGGGPTGVEIAAELAEFVDGMVKRYYHDTNCSTGEIGNCAPEETSVSLVHMGSELLEMFVPKLRTAALDRLTNNGVHVHLNTVVQVVTKDGLGISIKGPEAGAEASILSGTVIWAAGVKPLIPHFEGQVPLLVGSRLSVDSYFRLTGQERIFALGDVAGYVDSDEIQTEAQPAGGQGKPPKTLPMLAQVAESQSSIVAMNIIASIKEKKLKSFHYHSKGSMVSVGQWFAIGEIFSIDLAGKLTWWMWRTVYLFKFASWKKRIYIGFEWALELLYPRDITKLN